VDEQVALSALAIGALAWALPKLRHRINLSRAKHRSLAGHSRIAKRMAGFVRRVDYEDERFFCADDAPAAVVAQRQLGFERLSEQWRAQFQTGIELSAEARGAIADLGFTSRYRVPFQFTEKVGSALPSSSFVELSNGPQVRDLDGNVLHDVSGSYGVNLLGHEFYKRCISEGQAMVAELGPILGAYHPVVLDNARRLKLISGLDEVSFHMSGTEAVMQAVRLARYHTRKSHLVRFCGAYHGWWEDVQPGPGNPSAPRETYTLRDLDDRSLKVLRTRNDIACVLVNPLQALHPNSPAPGDSSLVDSARRAGFDRERYAAWLAELRKVCTDRGIVLIFDEVFLGFRLALRGAQEYFGVQADMVTYGKTLGGGLPVGVVCGRADLMRRYRKDRPADICFARGTFNAHPYVMASMNVFLRALEEPKIVQMYQGLDETWAARAAALNAVLALENLPVRVVNLSSVWTVVYERPSRYNWMLQFYLRLEGLLLSWVGTGRMIFSLDYDQSDFDTVCLKFVAAARKMQGDGWWSGPDSSNRAIRRSMMLEALLGR
jgi:glutamate-1-semialdehyde 2,1-aminomutase